MNLITYEGLAMIDTNSKIVQLHRATELHEHCTPSRRGSLWADFKDFWFPHKPNPNGVIFLALLTLSAVLAICIVSMLIGWGFEVLTGIEWSHVAQLLGVMR